MQPVSAVGEEKLSLETAWRDDVGLQGNLDRLAVVVAQQLRSAQRAQLIDLATTLDVRAESVRTESERVGLGALSTVLEAGAAAVTDEALVGLGTLGSAASEVVRELYARRGQASRSDLADSLAVSDSYLSHVLRDLEHLGLVSRWKEGRRVELQLTPRGFDWHSSRRNEVPGFRPMIESLVSSLSAGVKLESEDAGALLDVTEMLEAAVLTQALDHHGSQERIGLSAEPPRSPVFFGLVDA